MVSRFKAYYRFVKTIYRAIAAWAAQPASHFELLEFNLSPIDRHILYSSIKNKSGLLHFWYDEWRMTRCNKMLDIYGIDYFKGKRILELGCGHGDIGAFFAELGADVLCVDGRKENLTFAKLKHRKIENIEFVQLNLEEEFRQLGKFDLIIDFGLVYHLRNVDTHLKACFACADDIVVETAVCDSTDSHAIYLCDEKAWKSLQEGNESALEGTGSLPSPFYIERIAIENGFNIGRHFTADLNTEPFCYDWKHNNDNALGDNLTLRRFWRFTKSRTVAPGPENTDIAERHVESNGSLPTKR